MSMTLLHECVVVANVLLETGCFYETITRLGVIAAVKCILVECPDALDAITLRYSCAFDVLVKVSASMHL